MSAGRLNRRVTIERRGTTPDDYGNVQSGWSALVTSEPAEIRPIRTSSAAAETVDAASIVAVGLVEVLIRYSSATAAIRTTDRLKNARTGETFNIRAIEQPDMRGKYLRLVCQAGVSDG
jgi:head-tail adaptor